MKSFPLWTLCLALLHPSALGQFFRSDFQKAPVIYPSSAELRNGITDSVSAISTHSEPQGLTRSEQTVDASSDSLNATLAVSESDARSSTDNETDAGSTQRLTTSTEASGNATAQNSSSSSSTTTAGGEVSPNTSTSGNVAVNGSTPEEDDEVEEVIRGKPTSTEGASSTTLPPETLYQKTLALINDTYTLSILLPVGAGIVFASTIIVTVAACRCLSHRCRRRRLRKKVLPDSVKNFRPSDKARLLTESSDEEF